MKPLLSSLPLSSLQFVWLVHADANLENPSTEKYFEVVCDNIKLSMACANALKPLVNGVNRDKFTSVSVIDLYNSVPTTFRGRCSKADEVFRTIKECSVGNCPRTICHSFGDEIYY